MYLKSKIRQGIGYEKKDYGFNFLLFRWEFKINLGFLQPKLLEPIAT